ncbi:MAG: hypothetical protein ABIO70_28430 [Pseudomonadota bacterium]
MAARTRGPGPAAPPGRDHPGRHGPWLAADEPQHPPAYYLLARGWVGLFGDGIRALRVLSVLIPLLGLPALWWLVRDVHLELWKLER